MSILKLFHLLAALIWVGGMFFAYVVLRPAAVEVLEPPHRLRLWDAVFRRFFVWVWAGIAVLLASGFFLIHLYGGIGHVALHVDIMLVMGLVMMAIYGYVYHVCYRSLHLDVGGQRWKEAGAMLARIRQLIAVNLTLGLLTVCVALIGRGWT